MHLFNQTSFQIIYYIVQSLIDKSSDLFKLKVVN